jgi:rapamycin-insensitive companion of mTOR
LITLLSNKKGLHYLTVQDNWTEKEIERWKESENKEYVEKVEKCLMNALDFVGVEENNNMFRFPDFLNNPENNFVSLGIRDFI